MISCTSAKTMVADTAVTTTEMTEARTIDVEQEEHGLHRVGHGGHARVGKVGVAEGVVWIPVSAA